VTASVQAVPWPFLDHQLPLAFAHRGGTSEAPENTLAAFEAAVRLGYTHLETDVHRTADGVLVAFHDADLARMTGVPGGLAEWTWADLAAIDVGGGHRIPTLDELLEAFPDRWFNIDPKADAAVEPLGDAILRHGALDRVCVSSFVDARIARLQHRLGPRLCTAPGPRGIARVLSAARGLGPRRLPYGCVQVPPRLGPIALSASLVTRIRRLGLQVHVWTINDEVTMHHLLDLGVDGIMTDKVTLLRQVLERRGQWPADPRLA
jgi:glycerophosphoryl diester phosphodiesterase